MSAVSQDRPRILSFGGGVQSSALVAMLGQRVYPCEMPQEVWFCDLKNERPQTYQWIEQTIKPYLAKYGIPFVTLERNFGRSYREADIMASYRKRADFPLRMNRACTIEWKVKVMEHEAKQRGWDKTCGVEKHLGISLDELHRARTGAHEPWETVRYPLIECRLFRDDCMRICEQVFGAVPVKSGCYWCKYQRPDQWREVWEARADGRWAQLVEWEREVLAAKTGRHPFIDAQPQRTLPEWAASWERGEQLPMFNDTAAACDGGYCMV